MATAIPQSAARRRRPDSPKKNLEARTTDEKGSKDEVVWGKTPGGIVFRVPTTHDVLTALFHPSYPKSHLDILNLGLLGLQLVLFAYLSNHVARIFFLFYFAFWRAAYDLGLGWVLTKQSKKKWIVREVQRLGWLDESRKPAIRAWIKKQLAGKMGKDYSFDDLPLEYNTWLLFRQLVDIILLNDFLAYCMFAFSCFRVPTGLSLGVHIMRWIGGIALIAFNLWVKTEAHHVVKDYGWYWGDVFFQRGALVFDGVFEMAPHPMYSVGYAGYYGLSLIVGSYPVLFASLAAHACQFAFLVFFENPHIERMYGQRKLLAKRTPLSRPESYPESDLKSRPLARTSSQVSDTPSFTDGETATETETETESNIHSPGHSPSSSVSRERSTSSEKDPLIKRTRTKSVNQHDLLNRYFRKDVIGFKNIDLLRGSDIKLVLLVAYVLLISSIPSSLSHSATLSLYFFHALFWRFVHSVGLGVLLRAQSNHKYMVRHYIKHYHYQEGAAGAVVEAFANWKQIYTLSLSMTYVSFIVLAWKTYHIPTNWTVGDELLRHTLGGLLIALHVWAATESLQVLGVFGWFFGDFFIEDYPATLEYTGIYRYLNNPERTMSGAAFFGFALISGSKLVFFLAVISHLAHWGFLHFVENPHMAKLYGSSIRKDAGLTKVIKKVTHKQAKLIRQRAPELGRVAQEVRGTFEKVYEETAEVVEDFLSKSKPRIEGVVQDTKFLLQQSRERLVITRIASDISSYDTSKYTMSVLASKQPSLGATKFHLGEPIRVRWSAPELHSRKDWIGIYRLGANRSNLVTKTSSLGMWAPVHDEEWDGDVPLLGHSSSRAQDKDHASDQLEHGEVVFKGDILPWLPGKYEIRYHHDGKYNVMSMAGPLEIYVEKPVVMDYESVRSTLSHIVVLCLDSDPSLIPLSASGSGSDNEHSDGSGGDPDDFRFWSEKQAKRIAIGIKEAFDVEYAPEIIVADANVASLTRRILVSRELLER
ncbi:hypothetical protein SISSUDRAFT_1008125 [Sistotremastrum suecicum HHB10207 ss-3]|uniref:Phosphatidylethanolamine N-methyltransferase n=1 Tax=Sistotremastrum suecicum HHB10207 ss-3 TaxID=1314776 RepID=A0A166B2N1_9AGAM|nr:hypothetical protein SISSUDRAFT_1008125 [Sistotremastrum suecicum HHB10207 ss-3]